jgi:rhamnosyltransferase
MIQPGPLSSVCAVIVTFHPESTLIPNVSLLSRQVDAIVLVDNGSSGTSLDTLTELQQQVRCEIIRNESNLGIAAALNVGFRFAIGRQYDWIVSFDQDSTVTEGLVQALLDAASSSPNIGIICPCYEDQHSGAPLSLPKLPSGDLLTTITSGSMMQRSTFEKAGPFEEKLYIDSVDIEYSLRIRSIGLRLVQTERAVLLHKLGRITLHKFLGKTLATTNHSAARRYYMVRNRLFVLCRYPKELLWLRHDLRQSFRDLVVMLLTEKQRMGKLRLMFKGVVDWSLGRWGRQVPL